VEEIDRRIIALLKTDGRMSFTDLAKATGLSNSAAHQRVRRLEDRGVITGFRAIVDPAVEGRPLTAFLLLTPVGGVEMEELSERISAIDEVSACYSVAGEESYLLIARVANPEALEALAWRVRRATGMSTRTQVVLSTKFER